MTNIKDHPVLFEKRTIRQKIIRQPYVWAEIDSANEYAAKTCFGKRTIRQILIRHPYYSADIYSAQFCLIAFSAKLSESEDISGEGTFYCKAPSWSQIYAFHIRRFWSISCIIRDDICMFLLIFLKCQLFALNKDG